MFKQIDLYSRDNPRHKPAAKVAKRKPAAKVAKRRRAQGSRSRFLLLPAKAAAKPSGKITSSSIAAALKKAGLTRRATEIEADDSIRGAWRVVGLKKPLTQKDTDFLYGKAGWAARHGAVIGGDQRNGELYFAPKNGKSIVHKKVVARGAAFEKKVAGMKREIKALPHPKKHFMEGGDGVSGYASISLPGVKRDIPVGGAEWNSKMKAQAQKIAKKFFGPGAHFNFYID